MYLTYWFKHNVNFDLTVECCFFCCIHFYFLNILSGSDSKSMQQYHFGSQPVKPWHKQFVKKKLNYVWLRTAMLNRNNCSDWERIFSWHSGSSWSLMGPLGFFLSAPTILHKESSTCFPLFQLSKLWLQHPCPVLLASPRLPGAGLLCEYRAGPRLSFSQDRLTLPRGSFWCFLGVHTSAYKASFSSLVNRIVENIISSTSSVSIVNYVKYWYLIWYIYCKYSKIIYEYNRNIHIENKIITNMKMQRHTEKEFPVTFLSLSRWGRKSRR